MIVYGLWQYFAMAFCIKNIACLYKICYAMSIKYREVAV